MFRTIVACVSVAFAASAGVADDEKEHKLSVAFGTPNPSYKASISAVREVGQELWVRVDVTSAGGIAPAVIGKAKAEATVAGPDLPVKYVVFGKAWGWKNKETGIVFLHDLPEKEKAAVEKAFSDGKLVYEAKPKNDK